MALNRLCGEKRAEDKYLKTQVRFGNKDLEVWTKEKGSEDPFLQVSLKEFLGTEELPDFDDDIKWRKTKDRAPRRRVTSSRASSPVGRQSPPTTGQQSSRNSSEEIGRQMRQMSVNSDDALPHKRIRSDASSMDSCRSKDMYAALENENDPLEKNADCMEDDPNTTL